MTNAEYHSEELESRKQKQASRQNTTLKSEKLMTLSTKIGEHDLMTGVKKMLKLLEKQHQVRVVIAGESGQETESTVSTGYIWTILKFCQIYTNIKMEGGWRLLALEVQRRNFLKKWGTISVREVLILDVCHFWWKGCPSEFKEVMEQVY